MSNVTNVNPINIDTAGVAVSATPLLVTSIIVQASADNWAVLLLDAASGNTVFRASSAIANHRWVPWAPSSDSQRFAGIYVQTLTNITQVLVYTKAVELA